MADDPAEFPAALSELRMEDRAALSVAACEFRMELAAGQSLLVVIDAMNEPSSAPREDAWARFVAVERP